jgi:hypothetical protein
MPRGRRAQASAVLVRLLFFPLPRFSSCFLSFSLVLFPSFHYSTLMPRPRIHSDEAILKATRSCLLERGPAAPISAIAKKLGTSAPVVLARFGSRAALVQAALSPPSPADLLALLRREPSAAPQPGGLVRADHHQPAAAALERSESTPAAAAAPRPAQGPAIPHHLAGPGRGARAHTSGKPAAVEQRDHPRSPGLVPGGPARRGWQAAEPRRPGHSAGGACDPLTRR